MGTFGQKMRARRQELGMSMQELADMMGVNRTTIARWENGFTQNMKKDSMDKLAKALQVPVESFFGENAFEIPEPEEESPKFSLTPQQEILFDASEDLTDAEMKAVLKMIDALKSTRRSD